eukprot:CAMPEP_0175135578 /NCGR_PEP_ID=MMETSP0087-20121206/8813_1 /TAXON_ID=136419 /ORGANISM="Unknown Unknown, Strain D1" /LENGTH=86 /DNA_ID=CAMNT_0016418269 /DNA_START=243 /DNA_END=500 /DNA_ORIENTATION=+
MKTPSSAVMDWRQQAEKQILLDFYNSTNGPFWVDNTGWAGPDDYCGWYGVTCNGGSVRALYLYSNQLSGAIPESLVNLSSLQYLYW